jgi:hypothetical protein
LIADQFHPKIHYRSGGQPTITATTELDHPMWTHANFDHFGVRKSVNCAVDRRIRRPTS